MVFSDDEPLEAALTMLRAARLAIYGLAALARSETPPSSKIVEACWAMFAEQAAEAEARIMGAPASGTLH